MNEDSGDIFKFFEQSSDLKLALRYSYLKTGRQESTAEHSWHLCLMVPVVVDFLKLNLDVNRALNLALVHDLPEAITGDIDAIKIANNQITKKEKQNLENKAIIDLADLLPESIGKNIFGLWREYEDGQTEEAKFVKALDKLETTFQLSIASDFWDHPDFIVVYPDMAVKNYPLLLPILKMIKIRLKQEFDKKNLEWKDEFNYGLN